MNLEYQYCCVNAPDIEELEFIIDNNREVTYETLRKNINPESFKEVKESLGYTRQLYNDCGITLKSDYAVTFHKSKTPEGKIVFYIRHSAIEYIFY